jgi:hypothetical protein
MTVVAVMDDLMLLSRIDAAALGAGAGLRRVDAPAGIGEANLVIVDWSARRDPWGPDLRAWRATHPTARVVLFGRHTDLEAHAAARAAGLGPMWARSKLVNVLPRLIEEEMVSAS